MSKERHMNIELSESIAEGLYTNLAMIAYSREEFVIDFIRIMPNVPKAKVKSRVIITPEHAKRLVLVLEENIRKYEESFGDIKDTEQTNFPITFGGGGGEA